MGEDGGGGQEGGKDELLVERMLDLAWGKGIMRKGFGGAEGVEVKEALEDQLQRKTRVRTRDTESLDLDIQSTPTTPV